MPAQLPSAFEICYVEIPAPDLAKAACFYGTVFHWRVVDSDLGNAPYAMFQAGNVSGGLDSRKPAADHGVLLYIQVEDIPATLREIACAGGRIAKAKARVIEQTDEYGFSALFLDPNGNQLGLWSRH